MLLAFDDDGPGPVVVLLHGFPLDRSLWSAQRSNIGLIYRLISPDLRGHGKSAAPEGHYTMDVMAEDVIDTLDALQLFEPVVLGGLSMGGYVALAAILKYPERFRGLMLMDTRARADTPQAAEDREALAVQVETTGSTHAVVDAMLPRLFGPTTRERHPELIAAMHKVMSRTVPRAVVGALRGMAERPDRTADLASIRVPTLVLVGNDDAITPPEEASAMASALPDARLEIIPDAGHLAPLENPKASNAIILDFLNRLN